MEQKAIDFNVVITQIFVSHKWTFDNSAVYDNTGGRKSFGLIYLITGELNFYFTDGRFLKAKAGDFILLKPTDAYKLFCTKKCQHFALNFQILPSSVEGNLAQKILYDKTTTVINCTPSQHAQIDIFEQLCEIWHEKKIGYQMQAISLSYKLLHFFIKKHHPIFNNDNYQKIKPALDLIENNWNQDIPLSSLAKACNLSIPHFRHLFSELSQTSPINYRNSLRLIYAKDYLSREGYSITEVAYKCGFNDVNYFSRFFKQHTGVSPSKYDTL